MSSGTARRSCSRGPRSCSGSATCSRTPASRSTRWPPASPPSPGRAMIEALIDGERRPGCWPSWPSGKMRAKIPDLSMALEGRFGDHHALMCRLHLDHIDHLDAMIAALDAQIEAMMAPFRAAAGPADHDPGHRPAGRRRGLSEIGADVTRVLPRRRPPGLLGRAVPGQPRIRREAPLRQAPPRQPAPPARPGRVPPGRRSATRATSEPSTTGTS